MAATPMMQQYEDAKRACPEAILLFRMGDFYELFHDDAKTAARVLGLTLTSREKGEGATAMAGFPYHQLENYLGKLIKCGYRVGICDQVEDPKKAKGLVRREVTRIVTPGTLTDDALLDPRESNFLAAVVVDSVTAKKATPTAGPAAMGLAWVELSTGRFQAAVIEPRRLADELARIGAAECLLAEEAEPLPRHVAEELTVTRRPAWAFALASATDTLTKHFATKSLDGFGFGEADGPAIRAAGAVLDYLAETQKASLAHIDHLAPYRPGNSLEIDEATWRSLEITRTMRDGRRDGSLLAVMDRTATPMGSRRLAEWLAAPLTDVKSIDERLDAVAELVADAALTTALAEQLKKVYDLQRLLARVTTGRASPRDLSFIGRTLRGLPSLKAKLAGRKSVLLARLEAQLDLCPDLRAKLDAALADDCPLSPRDGGFIRGGFNERLDELRDLTVGGKKWIAAYQAEQIATSGITSLKVGFNKVFGYYLEVTNTHRDKVPQHYIRKQTIKNSERYITPELKEYEEKVLSADENAKELEYELFVQLRDAVQATGRSLQSTAAALAEIDVLSALASLARERGYCRPVVVEEPMLNIIDGRHPVLDVTEAAGTFVPNDTLAGIEEIAGSAKSAESGEEAETVAGESLRRLDAASDSNGDPNGTGIAPPSPHFSGTNSRRIRSAGNGMAYGADEKASARILLITGPNMAGKSTYIRQVALLTLMAQAGSFVPAKCATIGVADRIFARVGASDELSRGQSTFMVEMTETARILHNATPRSLVILDEIGRGTSTYDGLALAWAIVEHLHDAVGCRTLFATHYHELTELADSLAGVRNLNVAVREWQDDVVFLHKIIGGAADKSYGIHVARLAGVPRRVNERAKQILAQLEDEHLDRDGRSKLARADRRRAGDIQLTLFGPAEHPLLDELRELDIDDLTPMAALAKLKAWQDELAEKAAPARS
ncbi:MAG: DNA mismatch repair protein MutS [Pirellulales bacterium]